MILHCGCKSTADGNRRGAEYQDAQYGKGNRAHTPVVVPKDSPPKYRCTVCSQERAEPSVEKKTVPSQKKPAGGWQKRNREV